MAGFWREYSPAVGFSVLLHGGIVVAVVILTQLHFSHAPQTIHPLAIDAVVIDARTLHAREPAAAAAPAPAPAAEQPPAPVATPAPVPAKPAVERAAEAKARAAEAAAAATLARQRIADSQAEAARVAATLAAQKAAESAKKAAEAQRAAEAQKAQEAQKALDAQKAADAKKAAELRAKADREAELRRQLADEEHVHEVESGPAAASYYAQLQARMTRAWNKPPSAGPGTDCRVEVTQAPGGDVLGVRVMQCNGDAAVRQSIENAVYHASPLPAPPDPALFHRVFIFEFKPDE